jgi:hypothetical protein
MAYFGLQMLDDAHHRQANPTSSSTNNPFATLPTFVDTGATLIDKNNMADFIKARDESKQAPKQ